MQQAPKHADSNRCGAARREWLANQEVVACTSNGPFLQVCKPMPTVAANLIVHNEEHVLAECLRSIEWVDQIVVIDAGSSDQTRALAASYGAEVAVVPFRDFAAQRNEALQRSRCDWILSIDADERVSPALRDEILEIVRSHRCRYAGYRVPIHSWIFGRRFRWSGTENEVKLRLFRRQQARWVGAVHERVEVAGPIGTLSGPIWHESTRDVEHWLRKAIRYRRYAVGDSDGAMLAAFGMLARRLLLHAGFLDGPQGVAFALLSAWEAWARRLDRAEAFTEVTNGWHGLLLRVARFLAGAGRRRSSAVRIGQACSAGRCPGRAA